jgi:hypothetical protein
VFVNLTASNELQGESRLLSELWRQAAKEFGDVKFCEIRGAQVMENYPDHNCPTILVYKNGTPVKQIVTLASVGGVHMSMLQIDALLVEMGAVPDTDLRIIKRLRDAQEAGETRTSSKEKKDGPRADHDLDEEWD